MIKKTVIYICLVLVIAWLIAFTSLKLNTHEYQQLSEQQNQVAKMYIKGKLPNAPKELITSYFSPQPDIKLRTSILDSENAKGTIIMLPGFTGFAELSMDTIIKLNAAGYRVAFIEYRGQGKSTRPLAHPEKGYVKDYKVLANDIALFAEEARIKDLPLFFFSTSKGGHITMRMATSHDINVDAYALVVPMIKVNTGNFAYRNVEKLAKFLSMIGLGKMYTPGHGQWPRDDLQFGQSTDCNANPETAQLQSAFFANNEEFRTSGTTVQWIKESIRSSDILLNENKTHSITQPVKIFTAGIDTFVDNVAIEQFCSSLTNCEITHFETARHCINREVPSRMDAIINQSIELFDKVSLQKRTAASQN